MKMDRTKPVVIDIDLIRGLRREGKEDEADALHRAYLKDKAKTKVDTLRDINRMDYKKRRFAGLCSNINCKGLVVEGKTRCLRCLSYAVKYVRHRREKMTPSTGLSKQIEEMQKKADKYDNVKDRYAMFSEKLKDIEEQIHDLRKEIDPISTLSNGRSSTRGKFIPVMQAYYDRMNQGEYISTANVEKDHPDYDIKQRHYIVRMLKRMSGVLERKVGTRTQVYIVNEV